MPVSPDEFETDNTCPSCFEVNSSPLHLTAIVSGIVKGIYWAPWMPLPGNGIYVMPRKSNCVWEYKVLGVIAIGYQTNKPGSEVSMSQLPGQWTFFSYSTQNGKFAFANENFGMGSGIYSGGRCQIVWMPADTPL